MSKLAEIHEHFWNATKHWNPQCWNHKHRPSGEYKPWFRGHEDSRWKLIPSILRNGNEKYEFNLTKLFRLLAPGFGVDIETARMDQWLFVMQHHGAPTRLLDWSEGLNTAVFFACVDWIKRLDSKYCNLGTVFALNPILLNELFIGERDFPCTWVANRVKQTIKFAFGTEDEVEYDRKGEKIAYLQEPVAIFPSSVHARLRAQKSCFTLHGADYRDMREILIEKLGNTEKLLVEYKIQPDIKPHLVRELAQAGTTYSTIYPDLEGLARELKFQFKIPS